MSKVLAFLLLLATFACAISDKEILQTGLNGLFEQNKLPQPTSIVTCIDDDTAHKLVVLAGDVFAKAAKGSPADLIALIKILKDFGSQIPKSVTDCLQDNKELLALGLKYGITPTTDESAIEKKIIAYMTLHYLQVHGWFVDLNNLWTGAKYYQVGYNGAGYLHKCLDSPQAPNGDKDTIQQVLNGLFEQNKLPDPTTIVPCFDDDTAHKIVVFAGQILEKASKASPSDIIQLVQLIKDFGNQIPQTAKDCLDGNKEFQALGDKYGITPDTEASVIEKKVLTYVALHYLEVHKELGDLNNMWAAGKYFQMGYEAGTYGHKILGNSFGGPNPSDKDILQQALNGLFEQNKLPDPVTITPCIDDATAHKIVLFIGDLLEKAAKGSPADFSKIAQMVKDFGNQIPQSVKDCLKDNKEFETLGYKYGVTPTTDTSAIEKKVIAYIALHYLEVHKWLGSLSSQWKGGKYYQVGYDAAGYGHKVLGMSQEEPNPTDKETLQQALNGLFEQNKLPDPVTITPCIDDATAHKIVVFIGDLLEKAAKGSPADIAKIIQMVKDFGNQIPQSVKDCLDGNKEFETLGLKYGITPTTDTSVIEKKIIAYVTLHYLEVHKWLGDLSSQWKGGKYYQVGYDAAGYGHKILGMTFTQLLNLRQE